MSDFQKGQTVRLKSGGPLMTVEKISSDGLIRCIWFDLDQNYHHEEFEPETLKEVDQQ